MIRLDTDCTMVVKTDAPIKLTSVESEVEVPSLTALIELEN